MIWLQTFAFLVLAGLTKAENSDSIFQAHHGKGNNPKPIHYEVNSFPYYRLSLGLKNDDMYTSSIVSYSSGPLCSGFHINRGAVVTAASCVFRETVKDLFVISHTLRDGKAGSQLAFLPVSAVYVSPKYNFKTDEHNLAVLVVKNSSHVPVLRLPPLSSALSDNSATNIFMVKFSFDEKILDFSSSTFPAEADLNTKKCTDKAHSTDSFLCVSRTDSQPYSYGLADLGTPLISRSSEGDFLNGIFTGHTFNEHHVHYLYQNVYANLPFLYPFMSS